MSSSVQNRQTHLPSQWHDALALLAQEGAAQTLGMSTAVLDRLADQASALMSHGRVEAASALLEQLTMLEGTNPRAPFLLGAARATSGDSLGAIAAYSEAFTRAVALEADGLCQRILFLRAQAFAELGEVGSARLDLQVASTGSDPRICQMADAWLKELEGL